MKYLLASILVLVLVGCSSPKEYSCRDQKQAAKALKTLKGCPVAPAKEPVWK